MTLEPSMLDDRCAARRTARIALAAAFLLLCAGAPAAHADFFKLAGRYACLEKPGAVCDDAAPSGPGPFAPTAPHAAVPPAPTPAKVEPAPAPTPPARTASVAKPAAPLPPKHDDPRGDAAKAKAAKAKPPLDPLTALGHRLRAGRPAPGDLATLRAKAKAGEPRALEMLAWCEMSGVGTPRDPVHAYLLYGEAAAAGATDARATQDFIFRTRLSQEQRQQVLEAGNGRFAAAGP